MFNLQNIQYPPGSYAADEELFLISINDAVNLDITHLTPSKELVYLLQIKDWVFNYLMQKHPDVGRPGPVCPFVPRSVKEDSIYLTIVQSDVFDKNKFYEKILHYFKWFLTLTPSAGPKSVFRSIIMIIDIPNVNLPKVVEEAIVDLKSQFVEKKFMLGEFHAGPPKNSGIRNPDFRPLKSPIPLLVIREMVETDIEFLKADPIFLAHYKTFFKNQELETS